MKEKEYSKYPGLRNLVSVLTENKPMAFPNNEERRKADEALWYKLRNDVPPSERKP